MIRSRFLAVLVLLTLIIGGGFLWGGEDQPTAFATPIKETPPIAAPVSAVLVDSETLERRAEEPVLIAEATDNPTTTTTSSTTTTIAPSSTTTTDSPGGTAAPPTTSGGSGTTTSTQPPTTAPPTTEAGGYVSSAESQFAGSINSYRESNGLSSLGRSGALDSYARSWAKKLAAQGSLSHSDIGSLLGDWSAVGENVGFGGSVGGIFDALVASSGHRANMLGDFTHLGIGVYQDADGALWTAHVFAR